MKTAAVIVARQEAIRFLKKVGIYEDTDNFKTGTIIYVPPCKEAAAVKRSSMDLSRALSELRKG